LSRVAIIGSCITRDLWPILGDQVSGLLYISRTSLPSLFSEAPGQVSIESEPPEPLRRHQHNALAADLTKTALNALVAHEPTHLIFDFIDERFDLLATDAGLATHSWELEVSPYRRQPALAGARRIPRLSDGCELLWRDGLAELAALLDATCLRSATVILHEARWADAYLDASGRRCDFDPELELMAGLRANRADHNGLLGRYQQAFMDALPRAHRVRAPADQILADEGHRWGLSPFHYAPAYYESIWAQLRALGV